MLLRPSTFDPSVPEGRQPPRNLLPAEPPPAHHHPRLAAEIGDVLEWIAVEQDEVGPPPHLDGAELVCGAEISRRVPGAGFERLVGRQARAHLGGPPARD